MPTLLMAPGDGAVLLVDPGSSFPYDLNTADGGALTLSGPPTVTYTAVDGSALGPLAATDVTDGAAPASRRTFLVPVPAARAGGAPFAGDLYVATISALLLLGDGTTEPFSLDQDVQIGGGSGTGSAPAPGTPDSPGGIGPGFAYAAQRAAYRRRFGTPLTLTPAGGGPVAVSAVDATPPRDVTRLLIESGVNAAQAEVRSFEISPRDIGARPLAGSPALWQGDNYTVLACPPAAIIGAFPHTYRVTVYRTPPAPGDSAEGATETTPGQRVQYRPLASNS